MYINTMLYMWNTLKKIMHAGILKSLKNRRVASLYGKNC